MDVVDAPEGDESWTDLEVKQCRRCPALVDSRSRIVNGVGVADAELMFVGEAPGVDEDTQGKPFVGRSGGILDEALQTVGLGRADVRISNAVRCRPPENRDPSVDELGQCRSHLDREIGSVDPALVVALGKVPAETLLGRTVAVTKEIGRVETLGIGDRPRDVMICVHPAATLYDRSQRGAFERAIADAAERVSDGAQTGLGDY